MKKTSLLFLVFFLFLMHSLFGQTYAERQSIIANYDLQTLSALESEYRLAFIQEKQKALELAVIYGWEEFKEMPNRGRAELVGVYKNGKPKYYTTSNREGGITTRADKVHTGGGANLELNGQDMIVGEWDAGATRENHPLFNGRVNQMDNSPQYDNHATHVAGTMIGNGEEVNGAAIGMAPEAVLHAYDWYSDSGEMIAAAADGLLVSNHSYGQNIDGMDPVYLGAYASNARGVDNILYNAPYYLSVWAAGNDRQSGVNSEDGGYDYLHGWGTAKNTLVVAAVYEVLDYTGPNSVNMSGFSNWGPTDDGRIKPDISAKGVNMYSSVNASNYANYSGTSMASPSVAGSILLLQQHYNNLNLTYMKSSTLRGLVLHTADEAGNYPGPDPRFGWGLLNIERAAEVITSIGTTTVFKEEEVQNREVYTFSVQSNNEDDLEVSLTWTDPPGIVQNSGIEDDPIPSIINDLDLRVSQDGGTTFMPWKLDPENFSGGAINGDNLVDNIEKIEIIDASGEYIIQVSHKAAALVNNVQAFSLIVTGISNEEFILSSHEGIVEHCIGVDSADFNIDLDFSSDAYDTIDFTVSDLPSGISGSFYPSSLYDEGTTVLTLDGLESLVYPGDYSFMVTGTGVGSNESIDLYLILRILSNDVSDIDLIFPPDGAVDQPVVIQFKWESGDDNITSYDFELSRYSDFSVVEFSETTFFLQYLALGVTEGATYYWRVKANTACANGEYSEVYSFVVEGVLGLKDQSIEGLVIYPNPTANILNLDAATPISNVEIVNVLGQVLVSKSSSSTISNIDVSALSIGNYFIKVTSENNTKVLQFLKN
ncbi:MAG: S8 family serine peptidase [Flavobacteriaceae bacterium]|nr:S8 family serine peptidase [Flavobacteriaceae bacterium]